MKTIIILRHGDAQPQSHLLSDQERPLTARGQAEIKSSGAKISSAINGLKPRLCSSSFLRARESASIAAQCMGIVEIEEVDFLFPHSDLEDSLVEIRSRVADAPLILVGHNPLFSEIASILSGQRVGLGTGHAAIIDCSDGLYRGVCRLIQLIAP